MYMSQDDYNMRLNKTCERMGLPEAFDEDTPLEDIEAFLDDIMTCDQMAFFEGVA